MPSNSSSSKTKANKRRGARIRSYDEDHHRSIDRVRKNLLYHFMQRFFAEDGETIGEMASAASSRNKKNHYGFSGFMETLGARKYEGYSKLDSSEPSSSGQVVLDPHAPLKWTTKQHFVQNPTRYEALESLVRDSDEEAFESSFNGGQLKEIKLNSSSSSSSDRDAESPTSSSTKKKDNDKNKSEKDVSMKFMGIFLAAVSGLFFTLCSVTVKLLPRIDPSEVLVFRAAIQMLLILPAMAILRKNPFGPKGLRLLVYLQGVIGCLTVSCIFIGFARLPVGDAATIIFCSPIFVMIFSHVILKEHCGLFRVFVIGLLLFGVILIAKPPFLQKILFNNDNTIGQDQGRDYDLIGYGAALGGTLLTASNFVCMRKLRDVHFTVLIFAFSAMSAILSACMVPLVASFKLPNSLEEWVYAVLVGVFGLIGQSLLALALRYETAGVVSVTRSMDIAVAYIIQITWFGDIPLWTSILGAFVVIIAVFTMAMETAFLHMLETTFGTQCWC